MASKHHWDEKILDGFAPSVSYVMRICTSHLATIVDRYGNSVPPPPGGFAADGPGFDAMLESGLMHLRSLDDFFRGSGGRGPAPDMRANDWFASLPQQDQWKPKYWLDPRVRSLIDWNVVHLSTLRTMAMSTASPQWQLADYGDALCSECERFFDLIEQHCPARLPAFAWNPRADIQARAALFARFVGT
ncbi:MAG: hypothetical protein ACJ76I_04070 [Gaiellaceae bacterium]